jgi:hypothetical protein
MRSQVAEVAVFAALVQTVMAIENKLQIEITDEELTGVRTGLDLLSLCRAKVVADATIADLAECVRASIQKVRAKPTSVEDLESPLATLFVDEDFDFAAGY